MASGLLLFETNIKVNTPKQLAVVGTVKKTRRRLRVVVSNFFPLRQSSTSATTHNSNEHHAYYIPIWTYCTVDYGTFGRGLCRSHDSAHERTGQVLVRRGTGRRNSQHPI